MKIEIDLPEIKGYEYTGEYRPPRNDEWFLDTDHLEYLAVKAFNNYDIEYQYPILRKLDDPKLPTKWHFHDIDKNEAKDNEIIDYLKHLKERLDDLESR